MRVRFAPSPTGQLHVGGARTAVFNWLFARQSGGEFVLRIEDTDRARSEQRHTRAILDSLEWLGIDWDVGPVFQGEGVERHREAALRLLGAGLAYRDFSAPDELRAVASERKCHPSQVARERAMTLSSTASHERAARGDPFAVRFLVPPGETVVNDLIRGEVRFGHSDVDDLVILRADGTPTYNLAVTCDDVESGITHVVRGDDHLSNTPKQVLLCRALGLPVPEFGHVPLILGLDGSRLSKRHGARSVGEYASGGILPDALFNFLALLGWNPGDEREVMGRSELLEAFSLDRVGVKGAVFDEEKLRWLNGRHLAATPTDELLAPVRTRLIRLVGGDGTTPDTPPHLDDAYLSAAIDLHKGRARTVAELAAQLAVVVGDEVVYEESAMRKHWLKQPDEVDGRLGRMEELLGAVEWEAAGIESEIRELARVEGVGAGKYFHALRVALVGRLASADIFQLLRLLGRSRALARVQAARKIVAAEVGSNGLPNR